MAMVMMTSARVGTVALGVGLVSLGLGCGNGSSGEATYSGGVGGGIGGDECSAKILLGLYSDENCETEVFQYKLDIAVSCSGWTRPVGSGTKDNSATRFQCYKDRLCYTQYVDTFTCDAQQAAHMEDKEARTTCLKDPTPNIWVKLLGGTESCPEAPAGFECPLSSSGAPATSGLAAACEGN